LTKYNLKQSIKNKYSEWYIIIKIDRERDIYTLIRLDNNPNSELIVNTINNSNYTDLYQYLKETIPNIIRYCSIIKVSKEELIKIKRKI